MFGYDVFGAPTPKSFSADNPADHTITSSYFNSNTPWHRKSGGQYSSNSSFPRKYQMKSIIVNEPDPYNAGQTRTTGYMLNYFWPDAALKTGHYVQITQGSRTILWTKQLGDMDNSLRSTNWSSTVRQEIADAWNSVIANLISTDPCNTTDTYYGITDTCSDGGKKCSDGSEGLQAGEVIKVANFSKTSYSEKTIPTGTVVCPGTLSGVGSCNSNEERVLNYSFTGITNGIYVCVTKAGCPDQHNSDYKEPSLGYRDDYAACGSDCITGASKKLLSAGNGSCILKIDEWNDGVAENQAGQKSMKLALGKSGHVGTSLPYLIAFNNADSSLNYKAGSNGLKSYATEAEATDAFNRAAGRRKAVLNPPEIDDDGVIECTDALRQSNSDGSCAANCLSGHDFNSAGLCEEVESKGLNLSTIGFFGGLGLLTLLVIR